MEDSLSDTLRYIGTETIYLTVKPVYFKEYHGTTMLVVMVCTCFEKFLPGVLSRSQGPCAVTSSAWTGCIFAGSNSMDCRQTSTSSRSVFVHCVLKYHVTV